MVTEFAFPILGGISEHVHNLSRELVALGHQVTVLTGVVGRGGERLRAEDTANLRDHGYRTVRMGWSLPLISNGSISRASIGLGLKPRVARAIASADVVHAQGLAPPTLPLFALRSTHAPVNVGTFHTYFEGGHWAYTVFFRYVTTALSRLDRKIVVSEACIKALEPYFPGPYDVIPNGVDCDLFRPLGPGEQRPAGLPRILFVGRFDPRNALGDLLQAAATLKADGRSFTIQVAGDGPARKVYERQARRLGVWDRIEWLGLIHDDLPRRYREATIMAAPCVLASFGVILLEALASGTPIVCADNIGFKQVIRDGVPGEMVPSGDAGALAAAIGRLLDDPAARSDMALRGRAAAEERYAWPEVAALVDALYREVLEQKGLAGRLRGGRIRA
jgi:phosphatidyl-myo-inositol alpha-mannosyltransferase